MPGRSFISANQYRYGFNGQEKDDEIKGNGNSLDFTQRIYDPRLGKFFSIDPLTKKYPELTPYQFASNRPIDGIDMDGLEHVRYLYKLENGKATLIDVHKYSTDLRKGHGVEVVTVSNGEVVNTFIPMNAPPKPNMEEKTNAPGFMSKLESKMRGTSDTYEYEGEKGMEKSADLIDNVGTVLKATGIGAPVGEGLSLMADGMRSSLDFKNKDIKTAIKNTGIRALTFGAGKTIEKAIDGVKGISGITKEAVKLTTDKLLDMNKEAATSEEKPKAKK